MHYYINYYILINIKEKMNDFTNHGIETELFSLNGIKTYARLVDVHDGDTGKVVFKLFDKYYKFIVRIDGIDTAELHSKNKLLKEKALEARNRVIDFLSYGKIKVNNDSSSKDIQILLEKNITIVYINCLEFDKYGRLLVDLQNINFKSVNSLLISENLAYKYEGDTKLSEEEQIKLFNY